MCPCVISLLYPNSLVAQTLKNPPGMQDTLIRSLDQEDSLEKEMATTPVFLPGEFHGWRSLEGYSPWSHKEWDVTNTFTFTPPTQDDHYSVLSLCIFLYTIGPTEMFVNPWQRLSNNLTQYKTSAYPNSSLVANILASWRKLFILMTGFWHIFCKRTFILLLMSLNCYIISWVKNVIIKYSLLFVICDMAFTHKA